MTGTEISTGNQNSTCEWVDEAYSRRLWGQLLRRAESIPAGSLRSLSMVRKHADEVTQDRSKGKGHKWLAMLFLAAANGALDVTGVMYDRNGRFLRQRCFLRITQHAGQRLFERLRTNSDEDVLNTLRWAILIFSDNHAWNPVGPRVAEVILPHGTLRVVADAGCWVATTFIPLKPE